MKKMILLSLLIPLQVYAMEVISYKNPKAFLAAAALENIPFMKLLLNKGIRVDAADKDGMQAVHIAALNDKIKSLEFLLAQGAQIDAMCHKKATPLMVALGANNKDTVQWLLDHGASLEAEDINGCTAIFSAIKSPQCMALLIKRGADVNKKAKEGTPLIYASAESNAHVVQLLIQAGACLKDLDNDGYTSIYLAARFGHNNVVKVLLEAGADYEVADQKKGDTPLMAAAYFGHDKVVAQLLAQKIDINKTNKMGMTALMLAVLADHTSCAELLVKAGASVDVQHKDLLSTALHSAAMNGNEQIVRLLLNAGANPNYKNALDQTPLYYATFTGNTKCVQLLIKAGADVQTTDIAKAKPIAYLDGVDAIFECDSKGNVECKKGHKYTMSESDKNSIMKNFLKAGAQPDDIRDVKMKSQAQEMQKQMTCFMCSTVATNFCGKCRAVRYCSPECQRTHWPIHKLECKSKP